MLKLQQPLIPPGLDANRPRALRSFNSDRIDSDLVFGVAAAKAAERLIPNLKGLEAEATEAMNGFFQDLVSRMGVPEDLHSQTGAGAPWVPLSKKYVARKQSNAFFIYTGLGRSFVDGQRQPAKGIRSAVRSKSETVSGSLIKTLARLSGKRVFGEVELVTSAGVFEDDALDDGLKVISQLQKALQKKEIALFTLRLWTNVPPGSMARIESWMNRQGFFDRKTRNKLVSQSSSGGSVKPHRPLILPFMDYYARNIIPTVVRNYVRNELNRQQRQRENLALIAEVARARRVGNKLAATPKHRSAGYKIRSIGIPNARFI